MIWKDLVIVQEGAHRPYTAISYSTDPCFRLVVQPRRMGNYDDEDFEEPLRAPQDCLSRRIARRRRTGYLDCVAYAL